MFIGQQTAARRFVTLRKSYQEIKKYGVRITKLPPCQMTPCRVAAEAEPGSTFWLSGPLLFAPATPRRPPAPAAPPLPVEDGSLWKFREPGRTGAFYF